MQRFPSGKFGRQRLEFFPAPYQAPIRAFAALAICWKDNTVLLCDIEDRGWCIPSGRVEPFETSINAAKREAVEEAGACLSAIQYLGCYRVSERSEVRWVDVFVAEVESLGEIECPEESLGRKFVETHELPQIYHLWNPLTEAVFGHAQTVVQRMRAVTG